MSIRGFFTKKRIIWTVVVMLIGGLILGRVFGGGSGETLTVEAAKRQDLKATVLATGQVTSTTDLNLSFKSSGTVRRVTVKVGDKVTSNQLLANIDQRDQLAALTSARGALAAANANYQKVISGASNEQVEVAQKAVDAAKVALDNTKIAQDLAVENAKRTLYSTGLTAKPSDVLTTGSVAVSGTYSGSSEGKITLRIYDTGNGRYYSANGLTTFSGPLTLGLPMSIGSGLFATFSSTGTYYTSTTWEIEVPNTQAATYVTYYNAYQTALQTRDSSVAAAQASYDSAVASLNLTKAAARPADVQAAQAQILSAQGQVQAAQAAVEATEIRAAAAGTVTKIDVKVGELATAMAPVIVVQDVGNLYLEANISEANIAEIKTGQKVEVTFDALGAEKLYSATVQNIDPSSTVVSGVVNYKINALIDQSPEIKPGMTANMSVLTGEKPGVIAVPSRAVVTRGGKSYIRVITDPKKRAYVETEVTTGFQADGGLVEVSSGISEGQEIVTFIEAK